VKEKDENAMIPKETGKKPPIKHLEESRDI
jgi:hypothetical protein